MDINQIDRKLIWHPFTQEKHSIPLAIVKGEGAYLQDEQGKKYLDLISSWWVNLHGHANPVIAESIYKQALQLEHIIFAGFTHKPAAEICDNLSRILPKGLEKFFFSDNGSTSTEIALKMAYQYWYNLGHKNKKLFLTFQGGYHGDTFGAMSVGSSGFHNAFKEFFFKSLIIPYPATWQDDDNIVSKEKESIDVLKQYLTQYKDQISAFILEPIVQGASGMRMCRPEFLNQVLEMIKNEGIFVIFDEVMTGFGRTGSLFAMEQLNFVPDFLCISKGITGGFLPLAMTITSEEIYRAFWHNDWNYAFAHGHSYTANPLACSAAIASLGLTLDVLANGTLKAINMAHVKGIEILKQNCKNLHKVRILGTIAAFEIGVSQQDLGAITRDMMSKGYLIRPLNNAIYLLPPYCVTPEELIEVYSSLAQTINNYP